MQEISIADEPVLTNKELIAITAKRLKRVKPSSQATYVNLLSLYLRLLEREEAQKPAGLKKKKRGRPLGSKTRTPKQKLDIRVREVIKKIEANEGNVDEFRYSFGQEEAHQQTQTD